MLMEPEHPENVSEGKLRKCDGGGTDGGGTDGDTEDGDTRSRWRYKFIDFLVFPVIALS